MKTDNKILAESLLRIYGFDRFFENLKSNARFNLRSAINIANELLDLLELEEDKFKVEEWILNIHIKKK